MSRATSHATSRDVASQNPVSKTSKKVKLIGSGVYGKVYSAIPSEELQSKLKIDMVAIKRNLVENSSDFIGTIRELDFLKRLDHPNVLKILDTCDGNPFSQKLTPTKKRDKNKDDMIHFIFEKAVCDVDTFITSSAAPVTYTYEICKDIIYQTLQGLEYVHSMDIIHRDIKPANILLFPSDGKYIAKLCDFGLSKNISNQGVITPRVVSLSYRAPEILFGLAYDQASDLWALGLVFFELVSKYAFLHTGKEDFDDDNAAVLILKRLPYYVDFRSRKDFGKLTIKRKDNGTEKRLSWADMLTVYDNDISTFNDTPGTLDEFITVLSSMVSFFPKDRLSCSTLLKLPFFSTRPKGVECAKTSVPLVHHECLERRYMAKLAMKIYINRDEFGTGWWRPDILFHAVDLFDRYLVHVKSTGTGTTLQSMTKEQVYHTFSMCLYIFIKYFSTMTYAITYNELVSKGYNAPDDSIKFEKEIISIFDGCIFRPGVYEYTRDLTDSEHEKLLSYLLGEESNGKTREEIWGLVL
jgi:serine/threonine protein kinase